MYGPVSPSKAERLFEVERDDLAARELDQEVAHRRDADEPGDPLRLVFGELRVALADFLARLLDHDIEQVVRFDAEALASRHLDEGTLGVLRVRCRSEAELARRRVRQRHHLVREVMRSLRAFRMAHGDQRLLQQLLQIGLPNVDDVVDVRRAAVTAGARQRRSALHVAHSGPCGRCAKTR